MEMAVSSMRYEVWLTYNAAEPGDPKPHPTRELVARFRYKTQADKFARSMQSANCQARVVDNPTNLPA